MFFLHYKRNLASFFIINSTSYFPTLKTSNTEAPLLTDTQNVTKLTATNLLRIRSISYILLLFIAVDQLTKTANPLTLIVNTNSSSLTSDYQ